MILPTVAILSLLTLDVVVPQVTEEMKQTFLDVHNQRRREVKSGVVAGQPAAEYMPLLRWNDELAAKAQQLANQCRVGHDTQAQRKIPAFKFVGQNWAGAPKINQALDMWFDEHKNYQFDSMRCSGVCGHYTQMVWAGTEDIGCGVKHCGTGGSFPYGYSIVCNYGPAGNFRGRHPYEKRQ